MTDSAEDCVSHMLTGIEPLSTWVKKTELRFYTPVNPLGSCPAQMNVILLVLVFASYVNRNLTFHIEQEVSRQQMKSFLSFYLFFFFCPHEIGFTFHINHLQEMIHMKCQVLFLWGR